MSLTTTDQAFILNAIQSGLSSVRNEMNARIDASDRQMNVRFDANDKLTAGINTRLDTLNGKTAKNTEAIAKHDEAIGRAKWVLGGVSSVTMLAIGAYIKKLLG